MKAHEWLRLANNDWDRVRLNPDCNQRQGQFYMNHLYKYAPEVYKRISGSESDPFYVNSRFPDFLTTIWIRWED